MSRAHWSPDDRDEYEALLEKSFTAGSSSHERIDAYEALLADAVQAHRPWARDVERENQRQGANREVTAYGKRREPKVRLAYNGRVISKPARLIPGAVEVAGSDHPEAKAEALADFADGVTRVLVTKPAIAGMGMNFQRCARMVFVGLSDSYESYYQAIRRCYRYGQTRPVRVHIVLSDAEESIYANVLDKESTARATSDGLIAAVSERNRAELFAGTSKADSYEPTEPVRLPGFLVGSAHA